MFFPQSFRQRCQRKLAGCESDMSVLGTQNEIGFTKWWGIEFGANYVSLPPPQKKHACNAVEHYRTGEHYVTWYNHGKTTIKLPFNNHWTWRCHAICINMTFGSVPKWGSTDGLPPMITLGKWWITSALRLDLVGLYIEFPPIIYKWSTYIDIPSCFKLKDLWWNIHIISRSIQVHCAKLACTDSLTDNCYQVTLW